MARNFDKLRQDNYVACLDGRIVFDEAKHTYHVDGTRVPKSVTALVRQVADDTFDGPLIVKKNLASWRRNPSSPYYSVVAGLGDAAATSAILSKWRDAGRLGTALHRRLEGMLNDVADAPDAETDAEYASARAFVAQLAVDRGLTPLRTELSVFFERDDGSIPCAGQIDALFVDDADEIVMIDWKRTDKDLSADVVPFGGKQCGFPLEGFYCNEHHKYALQQSLYAVMLAQRLGVEVPPTKRLLLQIPPGGGACALVTCACHDAAALALLQQA